MNSPGLASMPTSSSGLVSMSRNSSGLSGTSRCCGVGEVTGWVMPRLFTTSTTPSMSQVSRPATWIRSCSSADPSRPARVTMPFRTDTVTPPGSACGSRASISRTAPAMSSSGRRKTLSRSQRLTIPTSLPPTPPPNVVPASTTGSRLMCRLLISLAAAGRGASGCVVMAGAVISSPAVRPRCFLTSACRRKWPPDSSWASRNRLSWALSRSASDTTPATWRPSTSTGTALIWCCASRAAICLYGVRRSTLTTGVVMTSPTRCCHRPWCCLGSPRACPCTPRSGGWLLARSAAAAWPWADW